MEGDPQFVILKHTAWLDTAVFENKILGSIVRRPLNPTRDFVPDNPLQYNAHELVQPSEPLTDFAFDNSDMSSAHATAKLSSIAHVNVTGYRSESVKLAGKVITYKKIQQVTDFWEKLLQDKAVSEKVPGWTEKKVREPPCLVVGIMIAEDVELDTSGESKHGKDARMELPIGAIPGAATGAPIALNVANPEAEIGTEHGATTSFKAKAGKSNIFALELQMVQMSRSFFSRSKKLVLRDDAPECHEGRLAGDEIAGGDGAQLPCATDLSLGGPFTATIETD